MDRAVSNAHSLLKDIVVFGTQTKGRFEQDVTEFATSKRLSYPHNCMTLDLSGALTSDQFKTADVIFLHFYKDSKSRMEIEIEDGLSKLERDNPESKSGYLGPVIDHKLDEPTFTKYLVEFSQNIFEEADPSVGCKNYPWQGFSSFNACDEDQMQTWVTRNCGFLPFFMAKEEANATAGPIKVDFECNIASPEAYAHFNGYVKSFCPRPCRQTEVKVNKMVQDFYEDGPAVELILSDKVMVTNNFYPKFSFVEVLASLGGSLGLWLGLEVPQLLQHLLTICISLSSRKSIKKKSKVSHNSHN